MGLRICEISPVSKRVAIKKSAPARSTLKTLAAELGFSTCTINKALTGKPRISEETRQKIIAAAERQGYRPNRLARSLSRPVLRIGLVCPSAWPDHYRRLMDGARSRVAELSDYRLSEEYVEVPDMTDGRMLLQTVQALVAKGVSGLVLALGDFPIAHRRMIWETLSAARLPFTLLGRVGEEDSPELTMVEHDSRACGSLAAELLGLMLKPRASMAVFVGRKDIHDHRMKIEAMSAEAIRRGFALPLVIETFDDPGVARAAAVRLLKSHSDVGGIYVATENIQSILASVQVQGLAGQLKIVATGVSEVVVQGLEAGIIHASLYQNELMQGRRAVDALFTYLETGRRPAPEILVPPAVVLRANAASFA